MEYPISEEFNSLQGEGMFCGVMMHFIRLAGCSVGKPYSSWERDTYQPVNALPIYTEQCTTWDKRTFNCDTDYRVKARRTPEAIVSGIPRGIKHVCITGGEPLIHNLEPLCASLGRSGYTVHLETSGTKRILFTHDMWVTVSPKYPLIDVVAECADEIKLLVDHEFNWSKVPEVIKRHHRVYIQPINSEHCVDKDNLIRCMRLIEEHPQLRLSLQLHKVLSAITGETVQ